MDARLKAKFFYQNSHFPGGKLVDMIGHRDVIVCESGGE
jgi:hypothetical protein